MDGSITTNKGIALIAKLLASKGALEITRVAVGDGTPPSNPATLNGWCMSSRTPISRA